MAITDWPLQERPRERLFALGAGSLADAELLGSPLRLTVGRRALEEGSIEVQIRRGREQAPGLPVSDDPAVLLEGLDATWQSVQ